jgi:hypothetical protein
MKSLKIGGFVVAMLLVAGITWSLKPASAPEFKTVYVENEALLEFQPEVKLAWMERLWKQRLEIEQRAIARQGAESEVAEFCRPLVERERSATGDLATVEAPELPGETSATRSAILAGRLVEPWNPFAARRIELYGMNNNGDRFGDTYEGAMGSIEFGVQDDGPGTFVHSQRFGIVKPVVTHSTAFVIGAVVGGVLLSR